MFTKAISQLNHKNILIIGLAREGLSTAQFLLKHLDDINLYLTDNKDLSSLNPTWDQVIIENDHVTFIPTEEVKNYNFDYVFKSPGIPQHILIKKYQLDLDQATLTSNTQLFFDIINSTSEKALTIGITGTKGKSTTTSHIYHTLKSADKPALLGGNIGVPPLRLLENNDRIKESIYVLEMSCHQLAELSHSPQIAVIQGISDDHLDYYADFETYYQAKSAICRFQFETDLVIYNQDSETASKMAKLSTGQKIGFGLEKEELKKFIEKSHTPLVGQHNFYNIMPAVIIARHLGIADQTITQTIETFKPVPHRIELVKIVNEVKFYNDSAASAPEATVAAIKAFENKPMVLIAGGSEKGANFDKLARVILESNIHHLVLFPSTGEKILNSIKKIDSSSPLIENHAFAKDMDEAVQISKKNASLGDIVLLSPASASFNMFDNYEDRGNQFKDLVNKL